MSQSIPTPIETTKPPPLSRPSNIRQNPKNTKPYNEDSFHSTTNNPNTESAFFIVANTNPKWRQAMADEYSTLMRNAEKFREIVGESGSSQSGKFTIFNCFDGGSGTVACLVKEGVKLYTYNIRTMHVEVARNKAIEASLADAISQGMEPIAAAKKAQQDGAKAAKQATRKAKRIIGPIISSGWDFFEAIYYGGTITEGFLRGTGTLFGTYFIGYLGEERFGRFGYLVGSQFGSWIGGRMGLMVYDIANGVHFLLQFGQSEENVGEKVDFSQGGQTEENVEEQTAYGASFLETIMGYVSSYMAETSKDVSSETVEEVDTYESPVSESYESPIYESYESPVYESYESNEEL